MSTERRNIYLVTVKGPTGRDRLQVTRPSAGEAEAAVREILMPGVTIEEVKLIEEAA